MDWKNAVKSGGGLCGVIISIESEELSIECGKLSIEFVELSIEFKELSIESKEGITKKGFLAYGMKAVGAYTKKEAII